MTISRISANEFAQFIIDGIASRDPSLDTRIGPIRDLQIDPIASILENQNDRVSYLSTLQSMRYADKVVPDDLDDLVFNEAIVRWTGSRAVTTVTFSRPQPPTVDIVIPVNFPVATNADPETGVSVVFRTIETKTMFSSAPMAYFNADTSRYEIDVAVASVVQGEENNVGAYTIRVFRRPLPGFDDVFNRDATTSGRGVETNLELADRYKLHVSGAKPSTPNGIERSVLDNFPQIQDVYVVYGNDANLTREQYDTGAIDVWYLGDSPAIRRYVVNYPGVDTLIPLDRQPLMSVVSVVDSFGTSYVQDTDFEVVTGEGEWSYSVRGTDGIRFLSTATTLPPDLLTPLTIDYRYNALCNILTAYFTQPEQYNIGQDRLYRWAQPVQIQIEASLKVRAGNPTDVEAAVRSAVMDYINGLHLGEAVEEFDIDSVVSRVLGVDNWTYTTLSRVGGTGVADLSIDPNEYARIIDADFVINLV